MYSCNIVSISLFHKKDSINSNSNWVVQPNIQNQCTLGHCRRVGYKKIKWH